MKNYYLFFCLFLSLRATCQVALVKDINQVSTAAGSDPSNFLEINHTVFFTAQDSYGNELWKSDGTKAGTVMVKDIHSGSGNSNCELL